MACLSIKAQTSDGTVYLTASLATLSTLVGFTKVHVPTCLSSANAVLVSTRSSR